MAWSDELVVKMLDEYMKRYLKPNLHPPTPCKHGELPLTFMDSLIIECVWCQTGDEPGDCIE